MGWVQGVLLALKGDKNRYDNRYYVPRYVLYFEDFGDNGEQQERNHNVYVRVF